MAVLTQFHNRQESWRALNKLAKSKKDVLLIHYSCEMFVSDDRKSSPRVTAIMVRSFVSAQTKCFSISQNAELQKIASDDIKNNCDTLEKQLLTDFYQFVQSNPDSLWVHWNMRDINYGFPALAHRAKVLGVTSIDIHDHHLFDLSRILIGMYGVGYIGHPRLLTLMKRNSISDKDFLTGEEEAKAFDNGEYQKLQMSTSRKVDTLENILSRTMHRRLENNSRWKERHGNVWSLIANFLFEHKLKSVFGLLGTLASIIALVLAI